jgi:hypothetical protein
MSSTSEKPAERDSIRAGSLTEADRALLLAIRAWTDDGRKTSALAGGAAPELDFPPRFGRWLDPAWVERLSAAREGRSRPPGDAEPASALGQLEQMHSASARVELSAVHPSWLIRALKEESNAVQRIVVASFPEQVRHRLQAELLLDSEDLKSERAADPACREWALRLWTERLVGGERQRPDDPPPVVAMTRLSPRVGYGLCRAAGLGKMMLVGQMPAKRRLGPHRRAGWEWLHGRLAATDADFQHQARRDVQSVAASKIPPRFHAARLGVLTFARLLADFEPFRLRWALQHWPYPIAKLIRSLLVDASKHPPALVRGESLVLRTAWDLVTLDGRITLAWPDGHDAETGAN